MSKQQPIARTPSDRNLWDSITETYVDNPIIRTLVELPLTLLNPVYGVSLTSLDAAVVFTIQRMRSKRLRVFYDELAKDKHILTEEIIQSEDFLHAFVSTYRAVINTQDQEKIRQFARLLLSATERYNLSGDRFEEYLRILEDLSHREWTILITLKVYEDAYPHKPISGGDDTKLESDPHRAIRFWTDFQNAIQEQFQITTDELSSILSHLVRTGLYQPFIGYIGSSGLERGSTSKMFSDFSAWVEREGSRNEK